MASVEVYTGLATIEPVQSMVQLKLTSMLLHPYPKIRNKAADALYISTKAELLRQTDWSRSPKELKKPVRQNLNTPDPLVLAYKREKRKGSPFSYQGGVHYQSPLSGISYEAELSTGALVYNAYDEEHLRFTYSCANGSPDTKSEELGTAPILLHLIANRPSHRPRTSSLTEVLITSDASITFYISYHTLTMVLLKQYIALASLATLGACDVWANNGPGGAVAGPFTPAPLSGNATSSALTTRDLADLFERDPEFHDFVQGAKKFVTQFIKRDISERDVQELAAQNPSFKSFMQKTGGFVAQMFKREAPTDSSAAGGAVAGIAGDIKAAAASPSGGATPEKQATPGGTVTPEKQTVPENSDTPEKQATPGGAVAPKGQTAPESGDTLEKQVIPGEGTTSGKPATPGRKQGLQHTGQHRGKHHGTDRGKYHGTQQRKHAHHQSQRIGQGQQSMLHAVGKSLQLLQARAEQIRRGPAVSSAKVLSRESDSPSRFSKGLNSGKGTGAEDSREARTKKLIEALRKHESQNKNRHHDQKTATQPPRPRFGVKYQGLEFQSEPYEMVRFQPHAHAKRLNAQKSPKQNTHTLNSPPEIYETSRKEWAEMQRQNAQVEKERHGEGHMDGQHGLGGTPGGQRGYGAGIPGRAGSGASKSAMHRRYAKALGNNMMMGGGVMGMSGMGEDSRTGGMGIGGIGQGGSGMRGSGTRGMGGSYGAPCIRDLEERDFEERNFAERTFEERDFEERDFEERELEEREFQERNFDERNFEKREFRRRDLEFIYDLLG
ncbi:MAG: hypothetical protein Q9187_002210 [Circinaria calcarea]